MQTAVFEGHSDDHVTVQGVKAVDDQWDCYMGYNPAITGCCVLRSQNGTGGAMRVWCIWDGCWSFAPCQIASDVDLPPWPIRVKHEQGEYTVTLEIDVPDDVVATWEDVKRKR